MEPRFPRPKMRDEFRRELRATLIAAEGLNAHRIKAR